jgi:hypothetical protein
LSKQKKDQGKAKDKKDKKDKKEKEKKKKKKRKKEKFNGSRRRTNGN